MSYFSPGQFQQQLQNKIKEQADPIKQDAQPFAIKKSDPATFAKPASTYAAQEMRQVNSSVRAPSGTAQLPKESIMHKSVHERMVSFVKGAQKKP